MVGNACAFRVKVPAGSPVKVRVDVVPVVGFATVCVETTVVPLKNETVMLLDAVGTSLDPTAFDDTAGQAIDSVAKPVAVVDDAVEPPLPPPQPVRASPAILAAVTRATSVPALRFWCRWNDKVNVFIILLSVLLCGARS